LAVEIEGITDVEARVEVIERRLAFEDDPHQFHREWEHEQQKLREQIIKAKKLLPQVLISKNIKLLIAKIAIEMGVDGHRADINMMKTASTLAAFENRTEVELEDVKKAAELVLLHRMRRKPFEETGFEFDKLDKLVYEK